MASDFPSETQTGKPNWPQWMSSLRLVVTYTSTLRIMTMECDSRLHSCNACMEIIPGIRLLRTVELRPSRRGARIDVLTRSLLGYRSTVGLEQRYSAGGGSCVSLPCAWEYTPLASGRGRIRMEAFQSKDEKQLTSVIICAKMYQRNNVTYFGKKKAGHDMICAAINTIH